MGKVLRLYSVCLCLWALLLSAGCVASGYQRKTTPLAAWIDENVESVLPPHANSLVVGVVNEDGVPYFGASIIVESKIAHKRYQKYCPLAGRVEFTDLEPGRTYDVSFEIYCTRKPMKVASVPIVGETRTLLLIRIPRGFCPEANV